MGPKPELNVDAKSLTDPHILILNRLEDMITYKGEVTLKRYTKNGKFYKREFEFAREAFMSDWSDLSSLSTLSEPKVSPYVINEPKSLCFCDIPINHLPEHMKKYGDIGLGVRKEVLENIVDDLFPVHYLPIKNKDDFKKIKSHIREKKGGEYFLGKYSKFLPSLVLTIVLILLKRIQKLSSKYMKKESGEPSKQSSSPRNRLALFYCRIEELSLKVTFQN